MLDDPAAPFRRRPVDIAIDGELIAEIAPEGALCETGERIAAHGLLATAGMINGHLHSWDYYQKGRVENLPMEVLMAHLRPKRPLPLTERHVYLRSMMAALECLTTGATTFIDDMSLGQSLNEGHVEAALQAYEDSGARVYLGFSMIDKPVVDSWPFVEECFAPGLLAELRALPRPDAGALLELTRQLAARRHPNVARVAPIVAPSAPHRCTDDFLRACRRLADDCALPTITHTLETRLQAVTAQRFYGRSMVAHLDALGFLGPNVSLIHAVWLTDEDRRLMAARGASLQYNPWSNAVLGSGVADMRAALDAGVPVSMGTDGCGVTFNASMLRALSTGAALGRVRNEDYAAWPSAAELWRAATQGGAAALGRADALGRLGPGAKADILLWRLDALPLTPLNDPARQIVHAADGGCLDSVFVDGVAVMRGGRIVSVDAPKLIAEFQDAHAELVGEIVASEGASTALLEGVARVFERARREPVDVTTTRGLIHAPACGCGA